MTYKCQDPTHRVDGDEKKGSEQSVVCMAAGKEVSGGSGGAKEYVYEMRWHPEKVDGLLECK